MSENDKGEKPEILLEQVRGLEKQNVGEEDTSIRLGEKKRLSEPLTDDDAKRRMSSYSRRGFLIGGAAAVFGYLGYGWLKQPDNFEVFQKAFRWNEKLSQLYYSPKHLAPEFRKDQLTEARVNGGEGLNDDFDPATWKLQVTGVANQSSYPQYLTDANYPGMTELASGEARTPVSGLLLSLDDIKKLPRVEMTTELKCIEGWSIIVNWAGARFSDFVAAYQPQFTKYIHLVTPDEGYYVGWDMPSILHPQTLLAYEMNGSPLTMPHGAPLRLVSTVKYGIKQIKRIGRIGFTDERPSDFWAEQGYDWYSGH
jgi:Sulfite oxidase and related enzymes